MLPPQALPTPPSPNREAQIFPRLIAAAALAATSVAAPVPAAAPTWTLRLATRYVPPDNSHSQYTDVLVTGRTGWFFGGSNFAGSGRPVAELRSKGRWHSSELPRGLHNWITGASAVSASDIWAVTYLDGKVLHWDGSAWKIVPKGGWSSRHQFTDIVALGPANVWLFGGHGRAHPGAGTWHLTGTKWTRVRGQATDIAQVSAVSAANMWGIGSIRGTRNALLHFHDSTWQHVSPANLAGFTYSFVLAVGRSDVWVAGSVTGIPELGHFNGRGWTSVTMPSTVPATGMCRDGRDGLWVIANVGRGQSVVLHRSRQGDWTTAAVHATSADEVLSCALVPGTEAVFGAGKAAAPAGSAAAVYGFGRTP